MESSNQSIVGKFLLHDLVKILNRVFFNRRIDLWKN